MKIIRFLKGQKNNGGTSGIDCGRNQLCFRLLKGKQEEYEAKVQAKLALNNAAIYRKNAARVRLNGSLNEDMMRSQKRAAVASAAAAAGEAGMGESPTTTTALATTSAALEQNILNERYRVESEAENYLYQARLAEEQARQHKKLVKTSL